MANLNASNKEKTIKNMVEAIPGDSWTIDKILLYGNYLGKGNIIVGNILDNYRDYFEQFVVEVDLDPKFYYQPMAFAENYYGTPDLDFLVMYFSNIPTLFEFNKKKIKVLPKSYLLEINRIMTQYKKEVQESKENPIEYKPIESIKVQEKTYLSKDYTIYKGVSKK